MPSKEDIEYFYKKNWNAVDRLRKNYKKIYFIRINQTSKKKTFIITDKEPQRHTFAFDFAVAKISKQDREKLRKLIQKWRYTFSKETKLLDEIYKTIKKYPHVEAYWL